MVELRAAPEPRRRRLKGIGITCDPIPAGWVHRANPDTMPYEYFEPAS
jgi:hypothetical protein